jgi:putative membrane protein
VAATFLTEDAKRRIVEAVQDVESKSSAEIVVSVRDRSDDYRDVDLLAGVCLAVVTIFVLIYVPAELDENLMPLETLLGFVVGSLLVGKIRPLKRVLLSRKRAAQRAIVEARAHFVEAGVSRTRDRSGILIFVSQLERAVCVVADIGIDERTMGDAWTAKLAGLRAAAEREDVAAFAAALKELGPLLGAAYPRREDDINELPDAPLFGVAS